MTSTARTPSGDARVRSAAAGAAAGQHEVEEVGEHAASVVRRAAEGQGAEQAVDGQRGYAGRVASRSRTW